MPIRVNADGMRETINGAEAACDRNNHDRREILTCLFVLNYDSWSIPSLCMPPRRSQVDAYDVPVAHWVSSSSSTVIHTHCPATCHIANSSSSSLSSSLSTGSATVEA